MIGNKSGRVMVLVHCTAQQCVLSVVLSFKLIEVIAQTKVQSEN